MILYRLFLKYFVLYHSLTHKVPGEKRGQESYSIKKFVLTWRGVRPLFPPQTMLGHPTTTNPTTKYCVFNKVYDIKHFSFNIFL